MARHVPLTPGAHAPAPHTTPPTAGFTEGIDAALTLVVAHWAHANLHSPQTLDRMTETVTRFGRRLQTTGITDFAAVTPRQAAGFITAPTRDGDLPELTTQHNRRTAVRTLYRTLRHLGALTGDPTIDVALPPRGIRAARPLTDDELTLARASAAMGRARWAPMRAVAWALGEATAVSSEITALRVRDLDLRAAPGVVSLPGTTRHAPRRGELSTWGAAVLTARVKQLRRAGHDEMALLAYGGAAPPGGAKAQASVCNSLREVLDAAGLGAEADVRPGSLRHWAGRRAYDQGSSIEQVAVLLGLSSLDAAADNIGLAWQPAAPRAAR